jgi:uncharacterized protein (TIGR03437 family)
MRHGVTFLLLVLLSVSAVGGAVRPELAYQKTIGGSAADVGRAVATDAAGNVYIAGTTTSPDFPVVNAYQKRIGGVLARASTDGGKTWTLPAIPEAVYAVAGTAKAPATIYAGTAKSLFKSTDSGKTWVSLTGAFSLLVNALWVDPDTPSTVHAATDQGMIRSTDGGATWKLGRAGSYWSMAASPVRASRLFAAVDTTTAPAIYRSTDTGVTWSALPTSPSGVFSLAADTANPDLIYAAAAQFGFSGGGATAVYRSNDGGDSWVRVSSATIIRSTFTLTAGNGVVFVGSSNGLMRSTDGGRSWNRTLLSSVDTVAIDPTQPQTVYANTTDGIFASKDGGDSWTVVLPVRLATQTIAVVPTNPPTVFVGTTTARNVFVTKMSGDGKRTIYSTFLGGSYADTLYGLAVDSQGNAYVVGYTYSTDFPMTTKAAQVRNASETYTGFLAKLGPNGDTLAYSTYLGGSTADVAYAVAVDGASNAYVAGYTYSPDFPLTPGAYATAQSQSGVCTVGVQTPLDAFVTKIDTVVGALRYSTFLGGGCVDDAFGIAVDSAGAAYVVGGTASPDFPVTAGALQKRPGSGFTGFLAKVSPQGTSLQYATYLGGAGSSTANSVAVDGKGAAYVTGNSFGFDSIQFAPGFANSTTPPSGLNAGGTAFAVKIDPASGARQYLTYIGGTYGNGTSIALDPAGNAWVVGSTVATATSEPFPALHPFQAKWGNGFVAELGTDGALLFASQMDVVQQVAVDRDGNAFVAGNIADNTKMLPQSAFLVRIDAAASKIMTVEEPDRILTPLNSGVVKHWVGGGEILVIRGSGLGPVQELGGQIGSDGRLATTLGGTKITFDGVAAPLLSARTDQVVCIVPFSLNIGPTSMRAETGAAVSNSVLLPTSGSMIEAITAVNADGSVNSQAHPASPGSVVTIYGAGFGSTIPAQLEGQINTASGPRLLSPVAASIGNQTATVLFAGPAPGQVAGVVQVNVQLPQLAAGSYALAVGWAPVKQADYDTITIWVGQ